MMRAKFEELLKRTIGLDANSVGSSTVARAVRARMSACNLKDLHAYWHLVHTSHGELQELIEAVVIPETWFFRDSKAFAAMVRLAREDWLSTHDHGVLRLLSLPCSTGEEPYSMAMALLDGHFPKDRFRIDAVDVSAHALAFVERGVYGKNSFRGTDLGFRDRYFAPVANAYELNEAVRKYVHFEQGNIFDVGFRPGTELYDIIFCRNILIYFDGDTRERAIGVLTRLLAKKGILFVGPSEAGLLHSRDVISTKMPLAFAFRKAAAARRVAGRNIASPAKRQCEAPSMRGSSEPSRKPGAKQGTAPRSLAAQKQNPGIEEIRDLADRGQLADAALLCEEYLRENGPVPEVLYLLGLIRDATGNLTEAADYYRKALYLDPAHHQALVHLALLREKQGDAARAKFLSDRARRVERQEGK